MTLKYLKRLRLWLPVLVLSPVVLFLLLAVLIYMPPVQNFVVRKVAASLSESMGMRVSVARVRLAFPLDLAVHEVCMADRTDTLLAARGLRLNVRLLPLFEGRADVDGFEIYDAVVNTKDLVADTYVRGRIKRLAAQSHGVVWAAGEMRLNAARLDGADLCVALSDTARKDTTPGMPWHIVVDKIDVRNTTVRLSLPGDSMRLSVRLGQAALAGGAFDTGRGDYAVRSFSVIGGEAVYATRRSDAPAGRPVGNTAYERSNAVLWDGFKPVMGLDPQCVMLSGLSLQLAALSYDSVGCLRADVRHLSFRERSGFVLKNMTGRVYMDSARLSVPRLLISTPYSRLALRADAALSAFGTGGGGRMSVSADARLGARDVRTLGLGYVPAAYLKQWPAKDLLVKAAVQGNMDRLSFKEISLTFPGALRLSAAGQAAALTGRHPRAGVRFSLSVDNGAWVASFLPAGVRGTVGLPRRLTASGTARLEGGGYAANVKVAAERGHLAVAAALNPANEKYNVSVRATDFPLGTFLPGSGLGHFSGSLKASGHSFDALSAAARLDARADIRRLSYAGHDLGGISFDARTGGGKAVATFAAATPLFEGTGTLTARIGRNIEGRLVADVPLIDVQRLGGLKDTLQVGADVDISFFADKAFTAYGAGGGIRHIRFMTPTRSIPAKDLTFNFSTATDTTKARVAAGDLALHFGTKGNVSRFSPQVERFVSTLTAQLRNKTVDQEALKRAFPVVDFVMEAGRDNPLSKILYYKGISYDTARVALSANPRGGMSGSLDIGALKSGKLLLDTVRFVLYQDTAGVKLDGYVRNFTRENPDKFEVRLNSYIHRSEVGSHLVYTDADGQTGVDLGLKADVRDEGISLSLFPQQPILAYRNFTVNEGNFIYMGRDKQIRANVDLVADDGTALHLYGEPADSVNDLTLAVNNFDLGELCNVMPYLPRMTGMLSADVHIVDEHVKKAFSLAAMITAKDFTYEGMAIGNIGLETMYLPKGGGEHYANAYVSYNDREVMQCEGTYRDADGGQFEGTADLHDFPLQMLNGFMAGTDVALRGSAGGLLTVAGTTGAPVINGTLDFDSAHLYSDVYGFDFTMDRKPIEIRNSRMAFRDYGLYSRQSDNPLVMNGELDMSDFGRIGLDFSMRADNFELINAPRTSLSMVFGKVYANYRGVLRGTADNLSVRGNIEVLDRTDMTYILKDSPLSVDDRLSGLVQFVDFSDTTSVADVHEVAVGGFDLTLGISISDAARFRCNLSDDGSNYVNLEGGGNLTLRLTQQGDMRLTGRFTANSGDMKYSLPVIPLKTFNIVQGSYVDFTGDVMNPTLNIAAKERVKATVTENDRSRSVAFDVGVSITQPLDRMGLEFTIEAPEDLTVQNQLAAMSADQRNKTAVAMLATGMYMTDDMLTSGGSGFKASNALNAFLQSEIQSIAGSALKTLDISVGMENNTSSTGTETTDYSFQFAKRFWNNRVSVIIGGKVSTGQDAQNSAGSFIDNVAVEYRLDKSSTRYVKVFYDRNTQDPLEGQLTQTGAGLVLRRKTDRLGELFIFSNRKKKKGQADTVPATSSE